MGKGKKQRVLSISNVTLKAIWDYLRSRQSPLANVWLTEEGTPLTVSGVKQIVRRLVKEVGITGKKASPHTFRHTFASNFLDSGGQELELQYLLGHNSLKMVENYSRATKARRAIKAHEKYSPVDRLGIK